jgi:glutathione S-transferase
MLHRSDLTIADFSQKPAIGSDGTPFDSLPVLRTPSGAISRRNTILRSLAARRADLELTGRDAFTEAEVDQWLEWDITSLGTVAVWIAGEVQRAGSQADHEAAAAHAAGKLPGLVAALDAHLSSRTFMVGERLSLADIAIASSLVFAVPPTHVSLAKLPSLRRWMLACVATLPFAGAWLTTHTGPWAVPIGGHVNSVSKCGTGVSFYTTV